MISEIVKVAGRRIGVVSGSVGALAATVDAGRTGGYLLGQFPSVEAGGAAVRAEWIRRQELRGQLAVRVGRFAAVRAWVATEHTDAESRGGHEYQITMVRLDDGAIGYVREALRFDRFLMSAGARWGMKHGANLPTQAEQILYVAAEDPADHTAIAAGVRAGELRDAVKAQTVPRRVARTSKWTATIAKHAIASAKTRGLFADGKNKSTD